MKKTYFLFSILSLALLMEFSCSRSHKKVSPIKVKVLYITESGEGEDIPSEVDKILITATPYDSSNENCGEPVRAVYTRGQVGGDKILEDLNEDNIYEEAIISDLPYNCPFYLEVFCYQNETALVYYGRIDGIILPEEGRRLFLKVTLYPKGGNKTIFLAPSENRIATFGHTQTLLGGATPDGRVLITGGFTSAQYIDCTPYVHSDTVGTTFTDCVDNGKELNECFKCMMAIATDEIYLFNQGSGEILKPTTRDSTGAVTGVVRLSTPRALHTATPLTDGKVVIAGGVDRAVFIFVNNDTVYPGSPVSRGWELKDILPAPDPTGNYTGALRSVEVFNPVLNSDTIDIERDGDFQRGGIETTISTMSVPRFGHAWAYTPSQENRISRFVVIGGRVGSSIEDSQSATYFQEYEETQNIFLPQTYNYLVERSFAAATSSGKFLFIFGGNPMPGNLETNHNNGIGEYFEFTGSWSAANQLPIDEPHPEWVRLFAEALTLPDGHIFLTGWYGSRCMIDAHGNELPTYTYEVDGEPIPTHICNSSNLFNNMIFDPETKQFVDTSPGLQSTPPHAMGSATILNGEGTIRGGWVVLAGGITNNEFEVTNSINICRPNYDSGVDYAHYLCLPQQEFNVTLSEARMWHRATELPGGNILFTGGINLNLNEEGEPEIIEAIEILSFIGACGDGYCEKILEPSSPSPSGEDVNTCPVDCTGE